MSRQNFNQPTSDRSLIGKISEPIGGRNIKTDLKFCTGDIQVIGVHLGYTIGSYSNKDGSGGLFITDGSSCFHIDDSRNIHIKTGKCATDGAGGGNLVLASDDFIQKVRGGYALEISGTDDETTTSSDGKSQDSNPAYSIIVYGDADIVTKGGDLKLGGDNILINAKSQVKITAGTEILSISGDGGGKIDFIGGEVTTKAKFSKFDLTGSFYVDGPQEITFTQKISVDPIEGTVKLVTPGAQNSVESMGGTNQTLIGDVNKSTLGNVQTSAYQVLDQSISGKASLNLGPVWDYSLAQFEGNYVGTPRENSRTLNAYDLFVGGTIGTSYNLTGMDVNLDSLGTISGVSVAPVDFIGSLVLLN